MERTLWRQVVGRLGVLLLIYTLVWSLFVNPIIEGSSISELRKPLLKRHISPTSFLSSSSPSIARLLSGSKINLLNSTRNARQIPEIPALYSAPKIPTPEIPALYSAPEALDSDTQNEEETTSSSSVGRATTEISVEEMDDENASVVEENSSDDYQDGVPTEKYPNTNDANQEEGPFSEYSTDSPSSATLRSNEVVQDDSDYNDQTEDSYNLGYSNRANEQPSPEYGAPSLTSSSLPSGSPDGQEMKKSGDNNGSNSRRNMYPTNNSFKDQHQTENNMQSVSQMKQKNVGDIDGSNNEGPQSFYLPPSYNNHFEEPQQDNGVPSEYGGALSPEYQQPPNHDYRTLPLENLGGNNNVHPYSDDSVRYPERDFGANQSYLSQQPGPTSLPKPSPQQQQQFHQQGQHQYQNFGKEAKTQPSSLYGPPGVNHVGSASQEDELEGLNEKIVDAEMLQRVQQIIEDHENQQKVQLDTIQKDNEKGTSFGYSSATASGIPPSLSKPFTENELTSNNVGSTGFSSPDSFFSGYNSNFPSSSSDYSNYNRNGNGESRDSPPHLQYGPPSFSSSKQNEYSNGYSNSNSFQQRQNENGSSGSSTSEFYKGRDGNGADNNRRGSSSPPGARGYDWNTGNDNELKKLSADVEYQKAILARHFTESEPNPQSWKNERGNKDSFSNLPSSKNDQVNSVTGPGQEYLPPTDNKQQRHGPHGNSDYSNGFSSVQAENQNNGMERNKVNLDFSVNVGTGIIVGDNEQKKNPPALSSSYGPPSLPSFQQQGNAEPKRFYARQYESSSVQGSAASNGGGGATESFSSKLSPGQRQVKNEPSSTPTSFSQFPETNPTFWSRTQPSPGPQTRYGPPSNTESKAAFFPLGTNYNNNNDGGKSLSELSSSGIGTQNQIKYSNGFGLGGSVESSSISSVQIGNNQGSLSPQQFSYLPPQHATTAIPTGSQNTKMAAMMMAEPRPIYGVPLAPVITLDSNNNFLSYSHGDIEDSSSPYSFGRTQDEQQSVTPNANYLPPSFNSGLIPSSVMGQPDLSNSFHLPSLQQNGASYGVLDNPSSSSSVSSTFLNIQGHNGNSNNHAYNVNHNDYGQSSSYGGSTSSRGLIIPSIQKIDAVHDASSIIPGVSNTFTLPLYDFSSSSAESTHQLFPDDQHRVGEPSSNPPVVVQLQSILQQLPFTHNIQTSLSPPSENLPVIVYTPMKTRAEGFRVSRRALSKQATISLASTSNLNQKQLSATTRPST